MCPRAERYKLKYKAAKRSLKAAEAEITAAKKVITSLRKVHAQKHGKFTNDLEAVLEDQHNEKLKAAKSQEKMKLVIAAARSKIADNTNDWKLEKKGTAEQIATLRHELKDIKAGMAELTMERDNALDEVSSMRSGYGGGRGRSCVCGAHRRGVFGCRPNVRGTNVRGGYGVRGRGRGSAPGGRQDVRVRGAFEFGQNMTYDEYVRDEESEEEYNNLEYRAAYEYRRPVTSDDGSREW